ncbi:MAG: hypothetical protein R2854_02830 [Caldilineaceae bacterium]
MGLNLALGWFADQTAPGTTPSGAINTHYGSPPTGESVVHPLIEDRKTVNFSATCRGFTLPAARLQNIPLYVMVVRATGAAYCAATLEGVLHYRGIRRCSHWQSIHWLRTPVYGGLFQSVLGQIGFRVDTRVFGTKIALVEEFDRWYGSAHAVTD